jgi:serine phosphatase RsbU (regulator of sigma subunit)
MGHGSLASLVAYSLFGIVREVAREKEGADFLRPATLVRRLNARYAGGSEGRPFFTLAYGTVDAATGVFRLARAGHTPCVLLPSRGEPEILNMKGGAIGVLEDLHVEEYEGLLVAGDRIVLVSDGYLEAAFGYDISLALSSLASFLAVNRALDLAQLAGALRNVVEEGRSTLGRDDDASLLLIERRA